MGDMDDMMGRISAFEADHAPDWAIDGYMCRLDEQIQKTPAYLNRIDKTMLTAKGNLLVVFRRAGAIEAGLYLKKSADNGQPIIAINGLFSRSPIKGLANRLIDRAIAVAQSRDEGHTITFQARIRILPSGRLNERAARVFARHGFSSVEIRRYRIADNPLDAHLRASAEPDGETYRALTLQAEPDRLCQASPFLASEV